MSTSIISHTGLHLRGFAFGWLWVLVLLAAFWAVFRFAV
jgi:hypothetical protein